jgi:hypothetical protein
VKNEETKTKMMNKQSGLPLGSPDCLYRRKLVILKFKSVAHICPKWQQRNGNFGNHAGIVVSDEGIVTPDVNNGAVHKYILSYRKPAPVLPGRVCYLGRMSGISPCTSQPASAGARNAP